MHWAHQVADRFGAGQLYVNLRGFDPTGSALDPAEAVRRFLDALDVAPRRIPAELDAQAALYRSLLAGRRMLIVLDNARDTAQVRPLLPGTPGCLVVITSRNQLTGLIATEGAQPIPLELLTSGEAHDLLAQRLGADRIAAEPAAVAEIITRCARLPLALALAAAQAMIRPDTPLRGLADELRDTQRRWHALAGDDPATQLRTVFSWSYHALAPDAARLFRLLGGHPGPDITGPAAASLTALPLPRVGSLLAELTRASLLTEHPPGRYAFHDLLRAYATELAHSVDPEPGRRAATHRGLDHYLHTANTANRLLSPARDPITLTPPQPGVVPEHLIDQQQALDWFTAQRPVLLAAVEHAASAGFDTHAWQLAWTMAVFLDRRGHWHDQVSTGHAAVSAAGRLGDPTAQALTHRALAVGYASLGRIDDARAHFSAALDLWRRAGDQAGQASAHHHLGRLWQRQGHLAAALDHARNALDLFQAIGHQRGQAQALNAIGWYHAQLGDHEQAVTACQRSLALHEELADRSGQANTWDSLGYAHHHLGQHSQAIVCFQRALDLIRDLGDRYNEADILTHLGDTQHATGNHRAARGAWQQALALLDDLDHPDAQNVRARLRNLRQHPAHPAPSSSPAAAPTSASCLPGRVPQQRQARRWPT